ncbi:MAG: circularly permuted type 2 ATP-grasp protein [Steroidobacteraceae bacterium]
MSESTQMLYAGSSQRYDELLGPDGSIRRHWRPLIEYIVDGGAETARRSVEMTRRLIVENGVTYNVYADPQGRDRPWQLDPLPLLVAADEWSAIEAGVQQRARLLNALLADLYGPQELIAEGVVPAELAFGHPNFLWAAHHTRPRGGSWLQLYAADLARAPDGRWWVLNDRTQTPSGLGYALENRAIVGRVLPGLLNELSVRPLTGFLNALRESLVESTEDEGTPLVVVLTPGPFNETYFEHAYLARQLGLPLVQGQDLTVRDDTVYLKTLPGLRRVHAILRRMDDDYCDPLELRPDSTLGVPGLLGAVRAGRVTLANGLGSGLLESAAWQGFLPGASRWLLNEPLQLPSVATWWCGEQAALDYVVTHLDKLVVKPTYPNQQFEPCFGRTLAGEERTELIRRLRGRPYAYVAQERVSLSQAPSWRAGATVRLAPRTLTMRVFAVATANGYRVMPGALARIAAEGVVDIVSTQRGGGSKDVWVLSGSVARAPAVAGGAVIGEPHGLPRRSRRDELPSQLVENLFWLGRYSERCEDKARLVRATLAMRTNEAVWRRARQQCIDYGVLPSSGDPAITVFDDAHDFGLAADLSRLGWCATQSRSRLSAEHWRSISLMHSQFQDAGAVQRDPLAALDHLLVALTALSGFALDDMTQDDGWRLLMLGRRLERVQFLATLLSDRLSPGTPVRQGELEWLLDVGGVSITYRTRYVAAPKLTPVLQLLVFDQASPRALCFQWSAIRTALADLARSVGAVAEEPFELAIAQLIEATASTAGVEEESEAGVGRRQRLAAALAELSHAAARASDRLVSRHFSLVDRDLQTVST